MPRYFCLSWLLLAAVATSNVLAEPQIFPGAVGFGTGTVGGSGRHLSQPRTKLIKVTTLADAGIGSFRDCAQANEPRTCVFEISGTVHLRSPIKIDSPYLTVAGQTAPSPGIMLRGAGIEIFAHDILIQHLEVRPGDEAVGPRPNSRDGVSVRGQGYNVVLDHLSVSWSIDENISTGNEGVHDVTFSNCIVAEALYDSIHPKGPHSMAALVGDNSRNITIRDSLFADNFDRNPRLKPGTTVEFVNNVVYQWGGRSGWNAANVSDTELTGNPVLLRFEGNYYKQGPLSPSVPILFAKPAAPLTRIFIGQNIGPTRTRAEQDEWLVTQLQPIPYLSKEALFKGSGVAAKGPADTFRFVLANAGSRPAERNPTDARIVEEVVRGAGEFKDCIETCKRNVGGWPLRAVIRQAIQVPQTDMNDLAHAGYTGLERLLQAFLKKVE